MRTLFSDEKFPNINQIKQANPTHAYKKGNRSSKGNYRPVSILQSLLKYLKSK